jgi:hypothetical protein
VCYISILGVEDAELNFGAICEARHFLSMEMVLLIRKYGEEIHFTTERCRGYVLLVSYSYLFSKHLGVLLFPRHFIPRPFPAPLNAYVPSPPLQFPPFSQFPSFDLDFS